MSAKGSQGDGKVPSPFQALDRQSLAQGAADHLRDLIVDGTLQPGEKLPSERELAARLGVSRPTLREAVRTLVIMGLVESRHGAGTFVAPGSDEVPAAVRIVVDLHEDPLETLFELRLLLEPIAAARAAARIAEAEVARLHGLFQSMQHRVGKPDAFTAMDAEFHRQIHLAAHSPLILSMLDGIAPLAARGRMLSVHEPGVPERTLSDHRVILAAITGRDPFEAEVAMSGHIMHIRAALIEQADR